MASSTASSCVLSCLCPAVSRTESGRPRPSKARCSLVVNPPRLRPSASQAPTSSPFFRPVFLRGTGRGASCTGSVLVGPHGGAVHGDEFPVQRAGLVRLALEGGEDLLPDPLAFPALEAVVTGALGPIASGQVF